MPFAPAQPALSRRDVIARALVAGDVFTFQQASKFSSCERTWIRETCVAGDRVWHPTGTCGQEPCTQCVIHRERVRSRRMWAQLGGFPTLLTPVMTLPEQVIPLVTSPEIMKDLEKIFHGAYESYVLAREQYDPALGWHLGSRHDWDLAGDKAVRRFRPHDNMTIPAFLVRYDMDAGPMFMPFDPIVDVDKIREDVRRRLVDYFGLRDDEIPAWNFKAHFKRKIEERRHWCSYAQMHVTSEKDYEDLPFEEIEKELDPRLWKLTRRGSCYGWLKACKGWSLNDLKAEARRSLAWVDMPLEKGEHADLDAAREDAAAGKPGSVEAVLRALPDPHDLEAARQEFALGRPGTAQRYTDALAAHGVGLAASWQDALAGVPGARERLWEALEAAKAATESGYLEETPAEPGEDREAEGTLARAKGRCRLCGKRVVERRVFRDGFEPELLEIKAGVFVAATDQLKYQELLERRKRPRRRYQRRKHERETA